MIRCRGQIFAAMVLENVIPPIPSELTMPLSASVWARGQIE
jgi:membrane protein DedA with SNARE-associated domain